MMPLLTSQAVASLHDLAAIAHAIGGKHAKVLDDIALEADKAMLAKADAEKTLAEAVQAKADAEGAVAVTQEKLETVERGRRELEAQTAEALESVRNQRETVRAVEARLRDENERLIGLAHDLDAREQMLLAREGEVQVSKDRVRDKEAELDRKLRDIGLAVA